MFKNKDLQVLPIFVAKDLQKLPIMHKSIKLLKLELMQIKNNYVTIKHFEELECKWYEERYVSILSGQCRVNTKRGACMGSGPMALLTPGNE